MADGDNSVFDPPNEIEISWTYNQDGTVATTVSGDVDINPGGQAKFDVTNTTFPTINGQLTNLCTVQVTFVSWSYVAGLDDAGGGTIKVGS